MPVSGSTVVKIQLKETKTPRLDPNSDITTPRSVFVRHWLALPSTRHQALQPHTADLDLLPGILEKGCLGVWGFKRKKREVSCEAENKDTFGIFFLQSVTTVSCVAIRMNKISLMVKKEKKKDECQTSWKASQSLMTMLGLKRSAVTSFSSLLLRSLMEDSDRSITGATSGYATWWRGRELRWAFFGTNSVHSVVF